MLKIQVGEIMKKFLVACIAFFLSFLSCNAEGMSATKLYEQKVNSVFFVETQNSSGSGIILSADGTFVTCFHVIEDANYINVKTKNGEKYKVTGFKYLNPENDIAILTITTTKKFIPFTINNSFAINVGETIYTISNPIGLQFVFSAGMINRFDKNEIQFSAPSSPGSSGGALFDSNGKLLGMVASQYNPSKAQNINFAIQNSLFFPHLTDKVNKNSKNIPWSDFVASKLNKKDLENFVEYAYKNHKFSMLYRYMPYLYPDDEVKSDDYSFRGLHGLGVYIDGNFDDYKILDNTAKWFALSILSNKNVEEAAFGLFVTSLFKRDTNGLSLAYEILKKYPNSLEAATVILDKIFELIKTKNKSSKDYQKICIEACGYYLKLAGIIKGDK